MSTPTPKPGSQPGPKPSRHFSTSILLWVRDDQPRTTGMDYWKGPHSGIIAKTPGMLEYRQIHLAEHNPGAWPETPGVETAIPADRRIDGIAEVTFQSPLSPLAGRAQTALAYADEVNVFRRTLLYAGPPGTSRWYAVAPGQRTGSRAVVYLRRRANVSAGAFRKFVKNDLAPALVGLGSLTELRTQTFLPWSERLWATPHVAHDNPTDQQFHASVVLGFADDSAREAFFTKGAAGRHTSLIAPSVSAIHAYNVDATLTFVKEGTVLPHVEL